MKLAFFEAEGWEKEVLERELLESANVKFFLL